MRVKSVRGGHTQKVSRTGLHTPPPPSNSRALTCVNSPVCASILKQVSVCSQHDTLVQTSSPVVATVINPCPARSVLIFGSIFVTNINIFHSLKLQK